MSETAGGVIVCVGIRCIWVEVRSVGLGADNGCATCLELVHGSGASGVPLLLESVGDGVVKIALGGHLT